MTVINAIGPLVLIVALGAILYRTKFLSAEVFQANSRLVYWVGLPCLLFLKTSQPIENFGGAMKLFFVLLTATVFVAVIATALGWALRLTPVSVGAFVQASFRGNLAYVGLPIVFFAVEAIQGEPSPAMEALAVLAIAPLVPVYNLIAVLALIAGQEQGQGLGKRLKEVAFRTVTNPLIIACCLGLLWSLTTWKLPLVLTSALKAVSGVALALALFAVGASLKLKRLKQGVTVALSGTLLKVLVSPLLGYLIGRWVGLSGLELQIVMIFLACPTAVASFVMAEQMKSNKELTAKVIVLSVLLCLPVLAAILALQEVLS